MSSSLSEEADSFVRRSRVALVATRSPRSRPFLTPLWFVVDGGALYLMTGAHSWAGRNVTAHTEVTLLLTGERGSAPGTVLRLRGTATCVPGGPPWRVLARVIARYYLAPLALLVELRHLALWRVRLRYYADSAGGAGYLRIVPTSATFLADPSVV